jgi:hypothetical protein
MFFATFASTVALGVTVDDKTKGTNNCMGVTELLLSLSVAGKPSFCSLYLVNTFATPSDNIYNASRYCNRRARKFEPHRGVTLK